MAVLLDVELCAEAKEVLGVFLVIISMRSIRTVGVAHESETFVEGPKAVDNTGAIPPILLRRQI